MLLEMTCASVLCFVPELNLYKPSVKEKRIEAQWPAAIVPDHFVNIPDIIVSTGTPLRYLTESEQKALDRALYKSVRIVHKGRPNKTL